MGILKINFLWVLCNIERGISKNGEWLMTSQVLNLPLSLPFSLWMLNLLKHRNRNKTVISKKRNSLVTDKARLEYAVQLGTLDKRNLSSPFLLN